MRAADTIPARNEGSQLDLELLRYPSLLTGLVRAVYSGARPPGDISGDRQHVRGRDAHRSRPMRSRQLTRAGRTTAFSLPKKDRRFACAWLAVLLLAGYAAYWNGTGAQYFNDHYQHAYDIRPLDPVKIFFSSNPYHGFYRPLEADVHIASQKLFGLNSTPIILFLVTVHGLLAWIIWVLVRSSGFSRLHAGCASVLMLLAQSNTYDVDSVACVSNVLSVFFGTLSLVVAARADASFSWRHVLALLCLTLSLLSKESGMAYAAMLMLILVRNASTSTPVRSGHLVFMLLAVVLVCAGYLAARTHAVGAAITFGAGRYDVHIGLNIPQHCFMFLAAPFISAPSPDMFVAVQLRHYLLPIIGTLILLLLSAVTLYGMWRNRNSILVRGAGLFAIAAMFPMALMNHVSEHQTYGVLAFLSILFGVGLGDLLQRSSGVLRSVIAAASILILILNVYSIQRKAQMIRANGAHTRTLMAQILPFAKSLPVNGSLVLVTPVSVEPLYSMYIMDGFRYIRYGLHRIGQEAGREDIETYFVVASAADSLLAMHPDAKVLTMNGGTVVEQTR